MPISRILVQARECGVTSRSSSITGRHEVTTAWYLVCDFFDCGATRDVEGAVPTAMGTMDLCPRCRSTAIECAEHLATGATDDDLTLFLTENCARPEFRLDLTIDGDGYLAWILKP